jgi:hypothetical protein
VSLPGDVSLLHLRRRLAVVEARVSATVARRRTADPDPQDRFRGLYISDSYVDHLLSGSPAPSRPQPPDPETEAFLARVEAEADQAEAEGAELRLRRLARSFGLQEYDLELLLIALAPDLDPRFERLYAYLNDDVSRRRASTGLALELCGAASGESVSRSRFSFSSPLVAGGLLLVEELDRPFLARSLRVPDRVASHLLGDDTPDPLVASVLTSWVEAPLKDLGLLVGAIASGIRLCYIRERTGAAGQTLAATALTRAGFPVLAVNLSRLDAAEDPKEVAVAAVREARMRGAGFVAGPIDAIAGGGAGAGRQAGAMRVFAEAEGPVILVGSRAWDPSWSREVPLILEAPVLSIQERSRIWATALDGSAQGAPSAPSTDAPPPSLPMADRSSLPQGDGGTAAGFDPAAATAQFLLSPEQVVRAARAATQRAAAEGRPLRAGDLQAGARAQNAAGLERLARRIEPQVGWDDLVLPDQVLAQLGELAARARYRDQVLDVWAMGKRSSKGRGISGLFAGDSGTGKTMSAEVVAGDLGLDLYVIDLSTVIDKYIGETEKNLDRIFVEADRVNGVLLFDEADALFGKRSDVKDSHDRYANVEVAYLLQRMELFDGLAVLTTNLRSNVDEAFTRRLDAVIDFPMPEEDDRRRLWVKNLRPELPQGEDIDLDFLARAFKLSGGNIRNIAVAAAYLAASEGRPVEMRDLIRATEREYRKLGHLCVEAEFGPYYPLIAAGSKPPPPLPDAFTGASQPEPLRRSS